MARTRLFRRFTGRRTQLAVFSGVAAFCLVATVVLGFQVVGQLGRYGNAQGDNMLWTLSQLEVDHAKLSSAARMLDADPETGTTELRRRFDGLYSRARTLAESPSYATILAGADKSDTLAAVLARLDEIATIIDRGDTAIRGAQDQLRSGLEALGPPIRRLSVVGLVAEERAAQTQRTALIGNLVYVTGLSVVMLSALLALLALFWRLYRRYRRRAMENRQTVNRMATILNTSLDAILVVSPAGGIIDSNPAAHRLFGIGKSDGPGISHVLLRRDDNGRVQPLSGETLFAACADGPKLCTRLMARDRAGRAFPVELSAGRASHSGDDVCVCFIRDISQRVAAETEMREARDRALAGERAKASFLGMISHEMRTPLNGILGALDLMQDTQMSPDQARYARIMQSSGQLVLNQVNDALDFTRAEGGRLAVDQAPFDLDAVLDELIRSQRAQAARSGTALTLETGPGGLGRVTGDARRLHQVLLNLVSNAIKFTHGGQVTLEVSRRDGGGIVEFQISDTGRGIPEADLPRIFDDFVCLDGPAGGGAEGTGLGLGIARRLTRLMGGDIGAESIEGEGSLFWVALPLPAADAMDAADASDRHDLPPRPRDFSVSGLDVLIVEDNPTNRFVLTEMLTRDGHDVTTAETGEAALAVTADRKFDLIFMDIRMSGIDGIETTRRIREGDGPSAAARIIALTAHFRPEEDETLRRARFEAVHDKPLRLQALRALLAGQAVTPAGPADGQGQLDPQVLDQLAEVLPGDRLGTMLDTFLDEGAAFIAGLDGFAGLPVALQTERLHRLAGSAAIFGATALQRRLARAEAALARGDTSGAAQVLQELPALWQETRRALAARPDAA